MKFHLFALAILALALCACSNRYRRDFGGGEAVRPAENVRSVVLNDVAAVDAALAEGAIPFDLRDYNAWVQGHVPGARVLSVDDLADGRGLPQDRKAPVLFMGDGPMDKRPEQAAQIAVERGYESVYLFPGGWQAWKAAK